MNKHIITIRIPRACDHDVRVAHRLACTCQMDRNSDGTLTKQEFMMMFGNVCEEVHVLLTPCSAHVHVNAFVACCIELLPSTDHPS